jgi:hypothetical protein
VVQYGGLLILEARRLIGVDLALSPHLVVLLDHLARGEGLGDQGVDVGGQRENPVELLLMLLLSALVPYLAQSAW